MERPEIAEIEKLRTLQERNYFKGRVLRNNHSFKEIIYFDIDTASLIIKVTIGGEELGVVAFVCVRENECVFKRTKELYLNLTTCYLESKDFIPCDVK